MKGQKHLSSEEGAKLEIDMAIDRIDRLLKENKHKLFKFIMYLFSVFKQNSILVIYYFVDRIETDLLGNPFKKQTISKRLSYIVMSLRELASAFMD